MLILTLIAPSWLGPRPFGDALMKRGAVAAGG